MLPQFTAEAALGRHGGWTYGIRAGRDGSDADVVPQQLPPDLRGCDHSSVSEIQCTPCRLHVLPPWPPRIGGRFVWRESVRRCITCYDHNGQPYPFCGPCLERSCSPFVRLDRLGGGFA